MRMMMNKNKTKLMNNIKIYYLLYLSQLYSNNLQKFNKTVHITHYILNYSN